MLSGHLQVIAVKKMIINMGKSLVMRVRLEYADPWMERPWGLSLRGIKVAS